MKLSEAIRLNGLMKPQGRGLKSMVSLHEPCALGGALQSIGQQPKTVDEAYVAILRNWKFTVKPATCPCGVDHVKEILGQRSWIEKVLDRSDYDRESILDAIVFLNDEHMWTRNQIADWVATMEPAEEVEQEVSEPTRGGLSDASDPSLDALWLGVHS